MVFAVVEAVVVIVGIVVIDLEPVQISDADEIRCIIRHTGTFVPRNLRIGTKRTRSIGREILRDAEID